MNPRIGSTFRLFVGDNGMDVVRALYQDMTGQPVVPSATLEGRKWIVEDQDLRSCLRYRRDDQLTFKEWMKSPRRIDEAAYLAKDDPWPVAAACTVNVRRAFSRVPGVPPEAPRIHSV